VDLVGRKDSLINKHHRKRVKYNVWPDPAVDIFHGIPIVVTDDVICVTITLIGRIVKIFRVISLSVGGVR